MCFYFIDPKLRVIGSLLVNQKVAEGKVEQLNRKTAVLRYNQDRTQMF